MNSGDRCRECGAAIPADSPGKFCARCLLGLGLSPNDGEQKPEGSGQPSQPSQVKETIALSTPLSEKPGDRIGRYRLLQEIGRGGCGVVYMAEQEEPVRRKVALKVIKLGMDTKQVVARFEAERQALALMDHSNIAKVLDAGATDTGRPYFVMELVCGIKITDYCDQNQLTTRQRLDLFIQVCLAVQHAHQKGIIHRDLKPSNVLVATQDGVPVPKVIDFGIAKATQGRLTDQTLFTAFEQFLGTPAYMSPEQAQLGSLDVDTRSDIYSLGVLLYELLTGMTPFDTKELMAAGLDAMRRTIQEREPPTPSTRLKQARQATGPPASEKSETRNPKSEIDKDLDWIAMKCLEKDRARRYETANGLARDIERHLSDEPVVAGPPDNLYRFQKMVQRNKLAFATTGGVVLALVVGLAIALWQSMEKTRAYNRALAAEQEATAARTRAEANEKKAQTEAARSEQVAKFLQEMLKSVGPSVAEGRDTEMLRDILDKAAERVGRDLADQPEIEAELRNTIGFAYWELGEHEKAEQMYRQSLELLRKVMGNANDAVANTLHNLADLLRRTDDKLGEAEAKEREALAIYEKLHGHEHLTVGDSLHNLSSVLAFQGRLSAAEAAARESLAINLRLSAAEHPNVGMCLGALGYVLARQGKLADAESVLKDAVTILRQALARQQGSWSGLNPHVELGHVLSVRAGLLGRQERWAEAETTHREALAMLTKVQGDEHSDVVMIVIRLANALAAQGKLTEAESMLRERIARLQQRKDDQTVAQALVGLARMLQLYGKLAEAEVVWREALAIQKQLSGSEQRFVANSLQALASVLDAQGKWAESEPLYRECLMIREKVVPDDWRTFNTRSLFGASLAAQGKFADAEPLLITGCEGLKQRENTAPDDSRLLGWKELELNAHRPPFLDNPDDPMLLRLKEALQRLVHFYESTDRPDQAAEWKRKLAQLYQSHVNQNAPGDPSTPRP